MSLLRYPMLLLMLPAVVLLLSAPENAHTPPTPSESVVVLVAEPGTPPAWAQTPSSPQRTRNDLPPMEAGAPGLPGPPNMPLPGAMLLTLAGGLLAWRHLRQK